MKNSARRARAGIGRAVTGVTGLLCAGLLAGCAGLWEPFLGAAPEGGGGGGGGDGGPRGGDGGGGGDDGGTVLVQTGGDCEPSRLLRQPDGTVVTGQVTTQDLLGVWGTDEKTIWAVGNGGTLVKWNGGGWRAESSPTTEQLRAVWGESAETLYVVGANSVMVTPDATGGWVEQQFGPEALGLNDVHAAGGLRMVVADDDFASFSTGAAFQQVGMDPVSPSNLRTVAIESRTRLALGGIAKGSGRGFVNLYEGTPGAWARKWTQPTELGAINGALFMDGALYAVSAGVVLSRFDVATGARTIVPHGFQQRFHRIRASRTAGRFWVVGDYGQLLLSDGQAVALRQTGTETDLYDAWEDPGRTLWVVGAGGTILRCPP